MSPSWLSRLGSQTAAYHAAADAQRLFVIEVRSTTAYRAFLERIYGFESAVELRTSGLAAAAAGARLRIGRLHRDLAALGMSEIDVSSLPRAPIDARTTSDALGWLFVIQRHVLLAGLIRRILASELPDASHALAYFETHADGGAQLREFGEALGECVLRGAARLDDILVAARRAFETQFQWYTRRAHRTNARTHPPEPRDAA